MQKRGAKPKGNTKICWSPEFAYAIGLITTDGCLSNNGRTTILVSKDREQIDNFLKCLNLQTRIGMTKSGAGNLAYRVQISDILFYRFLSTIGLTPRKSKTLSAVQIPEAYFFDFLRGIFDGDGTIYSYVDKRWKNSFMFYVCFASASTAFITWLQEMIEAKIQVKGHISKAAGHSTIQLRFAKQDGLQVLKKMYPRSNVEVVYLSRKRLKVNQILSKVGQLL